MGKALPGLRPSLVRRSLMLRLHPHCATGRRLATSSRYVGQCVASLARRAALSYSGGPRRHCTGVPRFRPAFWSTSPLQAP
jgi:hypothetical protein